MKPTPLFVPASRSPTDDEVHALAQAVALGCGVELRPVRLPVAALLPRALDEAPDALALAPALEAAALVALDLGAPLLVAPRLDRATRSAVLVASPSVGGLSDLAGRRVAWVSPSSATGYSIPRLYLESFGVDVSTLFETERFHGSHHAAAWALVRGDVDVIATHSGRLRGLLGCRSARVVASIGPIPADVLVAGRAVPAPVCAHLGRAMVSQLLGDRLLAPFREGHLQLFDVLRRQARELHPGWRRPARPGRLALVAG